MVTEDFVISTRNASTLRKVALMDIHITLSFIIRTKAFTSGCLPLTSSYSTFILAENVLYLIRFLVRLASTDGAIFNESVASGIFATITGVSFLLIAVCSFFVDRQLSAVKIIIEATNIDKP